MEGIGGVDGALIGAMLEGAFERQDNGTHEDLACSGCVGTSPGFCCSMTVDSAGSLGVHFSLDASARSASPSSVSVIGGLGHAGVLGFTGLTVGWSFTVFESDVVPLE